MSYVRSASLTFASSPKLIQLRFFPQLSGQRFSACTCQADASEHPGPNVRTGRGAPEIDALEGLSILIS